MNSREIILARIREGLAKGKAPMPSPEVASPLDYPFVNKVDDVTSIEVLFAQEFAALGGKFMYCDSEASLIANIQQLATQECWQHVHCLEPDILSIAEPHDLPFLKTGTYDGTLDAAITRCTYAVARTGSLIITSDTASGRALPVYTPIHLCLVKPSDLVFDIGDAIKAAQQKYGSTLPSMINIATGPSRTADIEKTLVVGVHGPKEVYVLYLDY